MILGSPGGDDQVMRTMQTLINVIDFGMNVQQAIEAPRWSTRSPASPFPHTMHPGDLSVEDRIPVAVQKALISKGHKLTVSGPWSLGANAAIVVDRARRAERRRRRPERRLRLGAITRGCRSGVAARGGGQCSRSSTSARDSGCAGARRLRHVVVCPGPAAKHRDDRR